VKIEMWPVDRLKPYANNPRKHPDKAIAMLAEGIAKLGFRNPIQVDGEDVIIAGHTRLLAAKKAGLAKVPVIVHADMSPSEAAALRVADNKLAELTDWDMDLLAHELRALDEEDFGFDGLGFTSDEIDEILGMSDEDKERAEEAPPCPVIPVTAAGDVWLMGRHRIVCGDSTKAEDVGKALNGVSPNLMVTDPPYGVEYDPTWRTKAGVGSAGAAKGKVLNDDRADWREAWALFPGSVAYVWHGGLHAGVVAESLAASGFGIRAQIVWVKTRLTLSRGQYHWQHEPAFYGVKGDEDGWTPKDRYEAEHDLSAYAVKMGSTADWRGGRKQSTVWFIEHLKSDTGHGTQKPIECMRRPILNNSSPGQAIYEPFSGSGSTLIACEITGRNCHAVELSPAYVDVAVLRWQKFTGGIATLEGDGRSFDEVAAARGVGLEAAE
jgi:DNA modification methylase